MISYLRSFYNEEDSDEELSSILNPLLNVMPKIADSNSKNEKDQADSCADAMFGRKTQKYALYFIVFFLACLTIKDLVELINEYSSNPNQTDLTIRFNQTMDLPNITFCMDANLVKSHWNFNANQSNIEWDAFVNETLTNWNKTAALDPRVKWDDRILVEAYEFLATINSFERETEASHFGQVISRYNLKTIKAKKDLLSKWQAWIADRDISFNELMQKVGEQIFLASTMKFLRTTFNESEPLLYPKPKIQWISQQQMCFSPVYDEKTFRRIVDPGKFFAFGFWANIENMKKKNQTADCIHVDFHGRQASLNRFMEGKARTRDGFTDQICIGQHHQLTLEVKTRSQMLPNEVEGTKCKLVQDGEETEFDCYSKCRLKLIEEVCNCTAHSLAHLVNEDETKLPMCDYLTCKINKTQAEAFDYTETPCRDKCRPDCVQLRYTLTHENLGATRPNTFTGEFHWGAFEYLNMEQSPVWTAWKFIAAVGGGIGVWLGLSVLSLIQGIGYLYNSFVQKVVVEKKPLINEDTPTPPDSRRGSKKGVSNGYSTDPNAATKIVVD